MGEQLDFGPSRFKCPWRPDPKHCAACRADYRAERRRARMTPQQKSADARKRRAKLKRVIGAVRAIASLR